MYPLCWQSGDVVADQNCISMFQRTAGWEGECRAWGGGEGPNQQQFGGVADQLHCSMIEIFPASSVNACDLSIVC